MRSFRFHSLMWPLGTALAIVLVAFVPAVHAQDAPIDIEVSGDAVPGGSVTVTVSTTDGSTISSVSWEQVSGVEAAVSGTNPATVTLGSMEEYKNYLIHVLEEPPIGPDQLPPNVPPPPDEFPGGLQNRFEVVAINPFSLEHASAVVLDGTVVTSSGTYEVEADILTELPWQWSSGIRNVAIGLPVLLHGKDQAAYDWTLSAAAGSSATLADGSTQNPEFTPDVMGQYTVRVTDEATGEPVDIVIYAGTFQGVIVGQDADGRPVADAMCTGCHNGGIAPDAFTPWAQTGHAEIATDQLNEGNHWGEGCFACHTVGYNTTAANGGFDDASDYQAFLDSGLINSQNPDNWTTMLAQYPASARLANIQCENCHGPQNSPAHTRGAARQNLSSTVCGVCHGEPLRHGRYQQWQLSAHANYELAIEEGQSGTCSKCHTANGFLAWLPVLDGSVAGDPNDSVEVTWTEDETHPQTCQVCHDPHSIGTTSGSSDTNATVRISGDTPELLAGFVAEDVGRGAICMTCHNTRRGLRNDDTFPETTDPDRAPHLGAQTDVIMGQNMYFIEVGQRSFHSQLEDSCVDCHMEATPPPPDLAYNLGGTNHTFYARPEICSECHSVVTAEDVQGPTEMAMEELKTAIESAYMQLMADQLAAGNSIDFDGERTVTAASEISSVEFTETHGRQALWPEFSDGQELEEPIQLGGIEVVPAEGDPFAFTDVIEAYLFKSGWNYLLIHADGSLGVHSPSLVSDVLDVTIAQVASGGGIPGGGDANPVACTTQYVYWTEIAAANQGAAGSVWSTDVVAKNGSDSVANVEFILHTDNAGMITATGAIDGMAQGIFEDVVGDGLGFEGKGALEICSDQPLELVARIYNTSADGTFGQALDGIDYSGMGTGDAARLLGLRQVQGEFRTNINVTNTGMEEAEVTINLYATDGSEVHSYSLMVGSGMSVQDLEPFRTRASEPNLGWGFAEVEVVSGNGIITSASVIDSRTNDPTTIPPKM